MIIDRDSTWHSQILQDDQLTDFGTIFVDTVGRTQ